MTGEVVDAVIVGAGPSGAVAAKRFSQAGMSVVVLEQGTWPDYSKARAGEPDYEITADRDWSWDPNSRRAAADYPIDDRDSDITALMYNGVGGSSVVYAGHWERFLPSDFRVRTLDGVADDWPFDYHALAPYYDVVENDFGVSGLEGDPCYPDGNSPPMPPVPLNRIGRRAAEAANRLGWHWWPGSNAIATVEHGPLHACAQRTACIHGCPTGAKGSTDRTHWPELLRSGVRLETEARVKRVLTDQSGRAAGVIWIDRTGTERIQHADATVLCANGIGTPRLLLMSADDKNPDGLANSSGLVGRRLMMHPFIRTVGLFEEDLESWRGVYGQHAHVMEFYETDPSRGFVRGAKWGLMPTASPLSVMMPGLWDDEDVWGSKFHQTLRARFARSAWLGIVCEDLPEESNRVVLSRTATDSSGLPAARIEYRTSENSQRMIAFQTEKSIEFMKEMGAYEVVSAPTSYSGWHLLGTTRMGDDPRTSVLNSDCESHDVPGLFVFDGSSFPTSSGVNPTATIAANALRAADAYVGRFVKEAR
ncbi:GMC family oxidoreductase [Nocardioides sp.]|uniref:GMC family oxidoreductase n=1 Tax=Nocardioides sp. TaxID=35761 RepID=UPI003784C167